MRSRRRVGSPKVGLNWHTDHYHLPEPGLFTYLHAIQVPEGQGDTRYANGIAADEALPDAKRAKIDGLKVLHSRARLFRQPLSSKRPRRRPRRSAARSPTSCIRWSAPIPRSAKRGLYLGGEWGSCIDGMPPDEAQGLYEELLHHMIQDRFSYQHRWQPGDVLYVGQSLQPASRQRTGRGNRRSAAFTASS